MASLANRTRKYFITICFLTILLLVCVSWYLYNSQTVPSDHIKLTAQLLHPNGTSPRNRIFSGSSLFKDANERNMRQRSYGDRSQDDESLEFRQVGKTFQRGSNLPVLANTYSESRQNETQTGYRNPLIPNLYPRDSDSQDGPHKGEQNDIRKENKEHYSIDSEVRHGHHGLEHQSEKDSSNNEAFFRNGGGHNRGMVFDEEEQGFEASHDQDPGAELPGKEGFGHSQGSANSSTGHTQNEIQNFWGMRANLQRLSHSDVNNANPVEDSRTQSDKGWTQDSESKKQSDDSFAVQKEKQFKEALNSGTFEWGKQLEKEKQHLVPSISDVLRMDLTDQPDQTKANKQSDRSDKIDQTDQAESKKGYDQKPESLEDGSKRPLSEHPSVSRDAKEKEEHVQRSTARPDSCQSCFHNNFPVLIDHPGFCHHMATSPTVLLLISTAPDNEHKRNAIRKTWGSGCQKDGSPYRCVFVLGRAKAAGQNEQIEAENKQHNDILQFGFMDAYSNLTYKTIMSLLWSEAECSDIPYVMKTDDDMYVNTELIPKMLTAAPQTNFVGGFCWGHSSPSRDSSSKWYVPFQTYTRSQFPPMCSGTGYIMSHDVVTNVLKASENIPFFHLEDVYIALCFRTYGVRPVRIQGFNNLYVQFNACEYRRSVMTSHQVPPDLLMEKWSEIQQCSASTAEPKDLFREISYPVTSK